MNVEVALLRAGLGFFGGQWEWAVTADGFTEPSVKSLLESVLEEGRHLPKKYLAGDWTAEPSVFPRLSRRSHGTTQDADWSRPPWVGRERRP